MARHGVDKRNKERARQQKQREKAEERAERRKVKLAAGPRADGVDPDIAGIVPGPQPNPLLEGEEGEEAEGDDAEGDEPA